MPRYFISQSVARNQCLCLLAAWVLGSAASLHAHAAPGAMSDAMDAAGNSYVSVYGGPSDFSRSSNGIGIFPRDDHTTAYGVSLGHYLPGQNYGMELAYTNFGEVGRAGGRSRADGVNLSLIGRLPIANSFNLLGKIGAIYGRTDVTANPASGAPTGSATGFDWSYGIGAELLINSQWSAVLHYDEHFMKFAGSSSDRVTATTMGVRMRF